MEGTIKFDFKCLPKAHLIIFLTSEAFSDCFARQNLMEWLHSLVPDSSVCQVPWRGVES